MLVMLFKHEGNELEKNVLHENLFSFIDIYIFQSRNSIMTEPYQAPPPL